MCSRCSIINTDLSWRMAVCPHFDFQGDLNALVSSLKVPKAFLRSRFFLWKATKVNGTAARPNRTMHSSGAQVGYVLRKPKSSLLQNKACCFCCQGFYYLGMYLHYYVLDVYFISFR